MSGSSKPQPGTRRFKILQITKADKPKFAVFCRSPSGDNAKFHYLHESYDTALDAARQHAAETASRGTPDFTYYVIEIKHRVGIEHGKLVDESMS